jgi:hypothetical protein
MLSANLSWSRPRTDETTICTLSVVGVYTGTPSYGVTGTDAAKVSVNSSTGVVANAAVADYETLSAWSVTWTVSGISVNGVLTPLTQAFTVSVTNVAPTVTSSATGTFSTADTGTIYTITASDPGGGTPTYVYSITGTDAASFVCNSSTGAITQASVPLADGAYSITVRASDGNLTGTLGVTLTGSAVTAYSAEAQQFFDRLITPPNSTDAPLYATLIDTLVSGGVWAKLDVLGIGAAADSGTSLVQLKSSSFSPAYLDLATGTPTFTTNVGWSGSGSPGLADVNWNFNPSTAGGNYTRNDACFFGWQVGTTQENRMLVGDIADSGIEIFPRWSDNHTYWMINSGTEIGTANTTIAGFWLVERTASNACALYLNNTQLDTSSNASAALVNQNLCLNTVANKAVAWGCGGSLTSGEKTTLKNALSTFLTAKGAI